VLRLIALKRTFDNRLANHTSASRQLLGAAELPAVYDMRGGSISQIPTHSERRSIWMGELMYTHLNYATAEFQTKRQ